MQIVAGIMVMFCGWLGWRSLAHDEQIKSLQYQIQSVLQVQSNTIPPIVEQSLREIRERINAEQRTSNEYIQKMLEQLTANRGDIRDNQKDILQIKESLKVK